MRKRINLIFVLVLAILLLAVMVACNQTVTKPGDLPDIIGDDISDVDTTNLKASLKFSFPIEMSSVFNSINISNFVLQDYVKYSIVYTNSEGKVVREVPGEGGVTRSMVHEDDRKYLSTPGHHNIRVTVKVGEDKTVSGSFALHLTDRSGAITPVTFTFKLDDTNGGGQAYPYFATNIDTHSGVATKSLESGIVINSWDEFLSMFTMGLEGKALASASAQGVRLSAATGFPFTVETNMEFELAWTDDIIHIKYDLRVPKGAIRDLEKSDKDPLDLFKTGEYSNLTAQASVGRIIKPDDSKINVYYGYFFAGWFNKANDRLWRFSNSVGNEDIELYARWVSSDYSFTIYTMGGQFAKDIHASAHTNKTTGQKTTINSNNAEDLGYTIINSESRFTLSGGELNRITFTGFHYGVNFDEYVAEVTINSDGEKAMLKFSEFYRPSASDQTILIKGDGDYLVLDDLYSDFQCTAKLDRSNPSVNAAQATTYVKWLFNAPDEESDPQGTLYQKRISKYYTELVFKNGYTLLADGSVRLDLIADWTVNELIIPEKLTIDGLDHPVTEIKERAFSNLKSITTVDMTKASALTTIGSQAFAYDESLTIIHMPINNSITNIGDSAFRGTNYETNYQTINKGAEFIVIGKMIYKYVGADKQIINLSNPSTYYNASNSPNMTGNERERFNNQLALVTSIEDGAFANCPSLESLSLSENVTTIRNNALSGLENFVTLNIPASGSSLVDIGENAFANTPFLSASGNLYDDTLKAIVIGKVFYRFIDTTATEFTLPATHKGYNVTHIAPRAFANCTDLEEVNFENEANIESIGQEAFLDTRYVRNGNQGDAFTVVNGILVNYYGPTQDANATNLIVPKRASSIGANAFGKQAAYFRTVEIDSNIASIENNAFIGAISLASIIFPEVSVSGNLLTNIPSIGEYSFAGSNGEMLDGTVLYFSKDVIEFLEMLSTGEKTTKDPLTLAWRDFYMLNTDHFEYEDIQSVVIDNEMISKNLMRTGKQNSAFTDKYGTKPVEGALIITSKAGLTRRASLSWSGNGMSFVPIEQTGEYAALWKPGMVNQYVLKYSYDGKSTGCAIKAGDPNIFIVTINNAIKELPAFYSSTNYDKNGTRIDANELLKTGNFWFEGLESQVDDVDIPTYFTSHPAFNVRFCYKDIYDNLQTIIPTVTDLRANSVTDKSYATIRVNFYGLGTYVFDFAYAVKRSRYISVEQTGAITIPVNGNAAENLRKFNLTFVGEDGNRTAVPITSSTFNVFKVDNVSTRTVNTSVLGMHTMTVEYTQALAVRRLEIDVYYTVILEADENLFECEPFNHSAKTARIKECKAAVESTTTLVLPSRCTIDGEEYTIAQIGYVQGSSTGVFEKYKNLTSVYLPETLQNIGVNTFKGCSKLQRIYTAMQATTDIVDIPTNETYFKEVGKEFKETADGKEWTIQPVELISLSNLPSCDYNEIIVGKDYVVSGAENKKYRIVSVGNIELNLSHDTIDIYLPDSIYSKVNISVKVASTEEGGTATTKKITPIFYSSKSNFRIKTVNNAPEGLEFIASGAFSSCTDLRSINLTKSVNLEIIDVRAFAGAGLLSIDLSKNTLLVDINNQVFENCRGLKTVTLHDGIEHIGTNAFSGCVSLVEISGLTADSAMQSIDTSAFNQCRSLTHVDIYGNVESIGANAFSACNALTIYCHMSETNFGNNWNGTNCPVVWNCETNQVASDGYVYVVIENVRYAIDTQNNKAIVAGQMYVLADEVVIPEKISYNLGSGEQQFDVKSIGVNAFENNVNITSIVVTSKLETIDPYAFSGCTNLLTFTFVDGNGLLSVASTAFNDCTSLVQIPQIESKVQEDAESGDNQ